MKKFGILAVAAFAALIFGATMLNTPGASADNTETRNVHCALAVSLLGTDACTDHISVADVDTLADNWGDEDGTLEASDLDDFEGWDANQLSTSCTYGSGGTLDGVACTNLIFVFVDDEKPVTLDTPSGLTSLQAGGAATDYICNTDGDALGLDNDCSDTIAANGDGVVIFHVVNADGVAGASRGDEKVVYTRQEDVEQSVDVNMVGIPDDIELTLVETTIGSNGSVAGANACAAGAASVDVTEALDAPNATVAIVTLEDEDNRLVTMWPLTISVQPPADDPDIATLGVGDPVEDITGTTILTIAVDDRDPAYYRTICGGSGTGETTIAVESITDGSTDEEALTVVGLPADVALTAAPAEIKCDGTETSTVSAKVTDSAGNNVANGTEVNFSVVALGTANPINTTTTDGVATSVITPLSNSSAGVTVIVTSGDVQTSIRVDCALPLVTQPTLAPPTTGPISPPDTGNGGYLAQDSGFPMWTLIALALGAMALVGGGLVARNSAK